MSFYHVSPYDIAVINALQLSQTPSSADAFFASEAQKEKNKYVKFSKNKPNKSHHPQGFRGQIMQLNAAQQLCEALSLAAVFGLW